MGGMFGGKKSSSKTESSNSSSNWIADNKEYQDLLNNAINQGANMDMPGYSVADYGDQWYDALNNMMNGADYSYLQQGGQFMQGMGQGQLTNGMNLQNQAQEMMNSIANMTQEDYQKGFQSEYNSDLVNSQINQLTDDVNKGYNQQVNALNQQASGTGNMGSSRAGVAQGVMAGQAQKAIASGTVAYQTAEEQNAYNRYSNMLNNQMNSASQLAGMAQNQISQGNTFFNQGMNYQNQYNQGYLGNQQNAINAGSILQGVQQNQNDIDRINQIMSQTPDLTNLGYLNQYLNSIAGWKTSGTGTSTTTSSGGGNGMMGGVLGAVGTGVGAWFGGPIGASVGGQLGGAIGNSM